MLKKAWEILSRWSEAAEDNDEVDAYLYDVSVSSGESGQGEAWQIRFGSAWSA